MENLSFTLKLAGLSVGVSCLSSSTKNFCANYLTQLPHSVSVTVTAADIAAEAEVIAAANAEADSASGGFLRELHERSALQRKIAEIFPLHGRFLMHGAAITYKNGAYLFCAPSGVGKSTHISLWKRYLGDAVDIINGDKPFLSLEEGEGAPYFAVHGSPWAGKEGWQKNRSAPLRAICFLSRGSENSICRVHPGECLPQLLRQVYLPKDTAAAGETLGLVDRLVGLVPLYRLRCDISQEAVGCCFEALTGERWGGR